jgi:nucleoside-diphosphate-sugar epimerase
MPKTLLTGANAFVAAHIIQQLVEAGHEVVGTVRKELAGKQLLSIHPEWETKLTIAVVEDITDEERWTEIFKNQDFDHVSREHDITEDHAANPSTDRSCRCSSTR